MITRGFHHISLISADGARTVRFYRDLLGIGLVKQSATRDGAALDAASSIHPDAAARVLYFGNDGGKPGTLLSVIERQGAARGRPGAGGIHHFALSVDTPETQLMWKRRLEDHGVGVSGPYNRGWFHSIYFTDPDGQIVEIATRGPGYGLSQAPDEPARDVVIPPGAQLRGTRDEAAVRARTHDAPVPVITPAMRLDGLHHISGMTDDVARIGEFYEAALGLRLIRRSVNQDDPSMPHWFWANYDGRNVAPHSSLTMFGGWESGGARMAGRLKRAVDGAGQTHAIAFRADDDEQLRAWQDHIRSLGTETTDVIDRVYFKSIQFRAPDGLLMEISTDVPGFALAEAA